MKNGQRPPLSVFAELNKFQRDCLIILAGLPDSNGLKIKEELEKYYDSSIHHGRLYPNLDTLVQKSLVEKFEIDNRSNGYRLTPQGTHLLKLRDKWLNERIEDFERESRSTSTEVSKQRKTTTEYPNQAEGLRKELSDGLANTTRSEFMTDGDDSSKSLFDLLRSCKMGEAGAIVGGHIDRNQLRQELYIPTDVDDIVTEFFVNEFEEDGKMLVITGSAGDGKSALLSRGYKQAREAGNESLSESDIHMDATAATKKTESYAQTLSRFLNRTATNASRAEGTRSGLAINLGLAIDFFERRGYQDEFPAVWESIDSARTEFRHEGDNITVINLGFRPMYSEHPDTLGEGILASLVDKFNASDPASPFHDAFEFSHEQCPAGNECPLRYNVEQFADDQVREAITMLLAARGIIENEYLNPRRIIHHLASIVLPPELENTTTSHDACPIGKAVSTGKHISSKALLWNTVFTELESASSSSQGMLDPTAHVSKSSDLRIIELGANPQILSEEFSDMPPTEFDAIEHRIRTLIRKNYLLDDAEYDLRTALNWSWFKDQFLSTYSYLDESNTVEDEDQDDLRRGAIAVNRTLQQSLKGWTGEPVEGDYIEYIDGIKTPEYRFLAKWTSPDIDEEHSKLRTKQESTPGQMWFVLQPDVTNESIPIPLTFQLYVLMHRIERGYSPNARDIERSEGMRLIQARLSEFTEKQKRTRIVNKGGEELFSLEQSGFGAIEVTEGGGH